MKIKTPKVTLLSWTQDPLPLVYTLWQASKGEDKLMSCEDVKRDVPDGEVRDLFRRVIEQKIPIGEHIDFVFMLENVSVSWREQAVRHRIGTTISPERVGTDIVMGEIPDLADSSFWSQSMRIQDMSKFAENGNYRVPQTILDHKESKRLLDLYRRAMIDAQGAYAALVASGIPMEDARELIPLGTQHRISWRLNIGALQHIVGKRGCWILQLGIWGPVIKGMIDELVKKVDPIFSELVTPPCIKGDEFKGCVYHEENRRRYTGEDKLPVCPLHWVQHGCAEEGFPLAGSGDPPTLRRAPMEDEMVKRAEEYREFWQRDPYTGKRQGATLKVIQSDGVPLAGISPKDTRWEF